MSRERTENDAFVSEACEAGATPDTLTTLALAEPQRPPRARGRERLLQAAAAGGRLAHFGEQVAELLDVSVDTARTLLDRLDDPSVWTADIAPPGLAFWVQGGPRVRGCVRGFVRIPHGASFMEHEHLGEERTLVLQGVFVDPAGRAYRPGDVFSMPAGSAHGRVHVPADGMDLLVLVVTREGYRAFGRTLLHRDG